MNKNNYSSNGRMHSVDFIKGICILLVIITHYDWADGEDLYLLFPFWVDMAVPVFMIISGFVYARSFEKHKIQNLSSAYSCDWIMDKIVRYTVPFTIAFIIEIIILGLTDVIDITPLQILFSYLSGGFGPGSYYFPVMIQFVFGFPVIYFIVKKYDFNGFVLCGVINFIYELLSKVYAMNVECYRLLVFRYTLVISFGALIAIGKKKLDKVFLFIGTIIGIVYIIAFRYLGLTPIITNYWTATSFWACLYVLPIAYFLLGTNICFKPMEIVGKASYNIFLVQMVYYKGKDFIYDIIPSRKLELIFNIIVCVAVGILFYYIETPITKYIHESSAIKQIKKIINKFFPVNKS